MKCLWKLYHNDIEQFAKIYNFSKAVEKDIKMFCMIGKARNPEQNFSYIVYDFEKTQVGYIDNQKK
jgi:hypothetical protein